MQAVNLQTLFSAVSSVNGKITIFSTTVLQSFLCHVIWGSSVTPSLGNVSTTWLKMVHHTIQNDLRRKRYSVLSDNV